MEHLLLKTQSFDSQLTLWQGIVIAAERPAGAFVGLTLATLRAKAKLYGWQLESTEAVVDVQRTTLAEAA